jgi:hypothetical protein
MKATHPKPLGKGRQELISQLLILDDGTVIAHNLTPTLAALLEALDLRDPSLSARVTARHAQRREPPLSRP